MSTTAPHQRSAIRSGREPVPLSALIASGTLRLGAGVSEDRARALARRAGEASSRRR